VAATGSLWAALSGVLFPYHEVEWGEGRWIFSLRCANCHLLKGAERTMYGPNLSGIGEAGASRIPGKSAEEYILESILDPAAFRAPGNPVSMPTGIAAGLSGDQLSSVIAYVIEASGGNADFRALARIAGRIKPVVLRREEVSYRDAEAGKALFFGKGTCHRCHEVKSSPSSGLRAPPSTVLAFYDAEGIRKAVRSPNDRIAPGYEQWQLWTTTGQSFSGRLIRRTPDWVELLADSDDGVLEFRNIPVSRIAELRRSEISSMPGDIDLTDAELDRVIVFLHSMAR
jgi:cytochrome c2